MTTEPPTATPTATPSATPPATQDAASAEDVAGRWCPTPESPQEPGCVTIALPTATYDDGTVVDITAHGGATEDAGTFTYSMVDAPFGTFAPAGVAMEIPDYYSGADLHDEDRIWNGQTGIMLVRA